LRRRTLPSHAARKSSCSRCFFPIASMAMEQASRSKMEMRSGSRLRGSTF
jgi:hypothetical protein